MICYCFPPNVYLTTSPLATAPPAPSPASSGPTHILGKPGAVMARRHSVGLTRAILWRDSTLGGVHRKGPARDRFPHGVAGIPPDVRPGPHRLASVVAAGEREPWVF